MGNYTVKIDTVAPTVTAPNITTGLNEATGAQVFYTGASASDQTSQVSSLTFSPPSGSHLPMGTTTVNFTAVDNAGNSSQGSFTVTVNQTGFVGSVLYVIGTSGNDAFVINGTNPSSVPITIGGTAVYGSPFNLSRGQTINVYGNAGNDTFTISGAVGATLDGGTGSNTFTVTSYTGTGTLTGGGSDTVVATKNVAAINLSNTAFSTPADGMSLTISGMGTANITGGAANNTYNVSGWTGAAICAAGGGTDTLNYTNDVSGIVLTNTSVAISGGASVTLSGVEVANLSGGGGNNSFDVGGWTGTAGTSVTSGGGSDTVVASRNANFTLTSSQLTIGTQNITLSGIGTANLTGGAGNNAFDLTGWTGAATLAAGAGTDSLTYGRDANFTLATASLAFTPVLGTARTWTLSGFETANLTGGSMPQHLRRNRLDRDRVADRQRCHLDRCRNQEYGHDAHQQFADRRHHEHDALGHHAQRVDREQHRISRDRRIGLQRQLDPDRRRNGPCQALRWLGERHPESHRKRPSRPGGRRRRRHVAARKAAVGRSSSAAWAPTA